MGNGFLSLEADGASYVDTMYSKSILAPSVPRAGTIGSANRIYPQLGFLSVAGRRGTQAYPCRRQFRYLETNDGETRIDKIIRRANELEDMKLKFSNLNS